jgi:hypothetical protein
VGDDPRQEGGHGLAPNTPNVICNTISIKGVEDEFADDVGGVVFGVFNGLGDAASFDRLVEADPLEDLVGGLGDGLGDQEADQQDDQKADEFRDEDRDPALGVFDASAPSNGSDHLILADNRRRAATHW